MVLQTKPAFSRFSNALKSTQFHSFIHSFTLPLLQHAIFPRTV